MIKKNSITNSITNINRKLIYKYNSYVYISVTSSHLQHGRHGLSRAPKRAST